LSELRSQESGDKRQEAEARDQRPETRDQGSGRTSLIAIDIGIAIEIGYSAKCKVRMKNAE
jgi:hypothetical protein